MSLLCFHSFIPSSISDYFCITLRGVKSGWGIIGRINMYFCVSVHFSPLSLPSQGRVGGRESRKSKRHIMETQVSAHFLFDLSAFNSFLSSTYCDEIWILCFILTLNLRPQYRWTVGCRSSVPMYNSNANLTVHVQFTMITKNNWLLPHHICTYYCHSFYEGFWRCSLLQNTYKKPGSSLYSGVCKHLLSPPDRC